ncbi:MAG: hypothetical protein HYX61_00895 [Gammaproteobacteria bacterium]|jgi:hypothetical protein|nr:hypothetical protein [Gammaproteobacteria bacterium]
MVDKIAKDPDTFQDEVVSLEKAIPIHETIFHYNAVSKVFENAFKKYVNLDPSELEKLIDSLPDEPKKGDANFLGLKFEELFNIPVEVSRSEINKVTQQNIDGSIESLERILDLNANLNNDEDGILSVNTNRTFLISFIDSSIPYPTYNYELPPPINGEHGLPTTPYITVDSAFTNGMNTEVLLNTQAAVPLQGNIFTEGAGGGTIINAVFSPPARPGSIEIRNIPGQVILITPEGNVFVFYTASVNGHTIGDFVYTLNNAILTPPQPYITVNNKRVHKDLFMYSVMDEFYDTNVNTIEIQIVDDNPVATNQNAPSIIIEADIQNIGSNELPVVNKMSGSLIVPSIQATPPGPGDLSDNRFSVNGGSVTNVTVAGGVTVSNFLTFDVTDAQGNTLVVEKFTGNYVYTLNAPFHNINNQPYNENFNYEFTDFEGQTASAVLTVTSNDDAPQAVDLTNAISEADIKDIGTNLSNNFATVTGLLVPLAPTTLTSRYGADGPNSTGGVTNAALTNESGTSGVTAITTFGTITNVQIANSNGAFTNANLGHASVVVTDSLGNTLVIDRITNQYLYTLNAAFTDINDQPAILTFTYELTDGDGSTDTADLVITIDDDQPIANIKLNTANETLLFVNGTNIATGNIITDNNGFGVSLLGADFGTVSKINNATAVGGIISVGTTYGSIEVYATAQAGHQIGDYIYSLDSTKTQPVNDALFQQVVDTISYQLTDGDGSTVSSDLKITVTLNQSPEANDDIGTIDQALVLSVNAAGGVLANDVVSIGDTKVVSAVNGLANKVGNQLVLGSGALLTLNSDGSYSYDPNGNFEGGGADSFTYTLIEAEGLTSDATVNITITAPQAVDDNGSVSSNATLSVNSALGLLSNDVKSPADNNLVVAKVDGAGANVGVQIALVSGALVKVNSDGSYDYDPNGSFAVDGNDTFTYQAADGLNGLSNIATVTISVDVPPIILDLNHDGKIDLISLEESQVAWKFPCGNNHTIGWVGPEDGILVYDYDNDGKITKLDEFSFVSYHPDAKTDLDGLRLAFDSNHDGIFDINDEHFSQFAVWQDSNSNGITDAGELISLIDRGISSIILSSTPQNQDIDGNIIYGITTYLTNDGQSHLAADVGLKVGHALSIKDALIEQTEIDFSALAENRTQAQEPAILTEYQTIEIINVPMMNLLVDLVPSPLAGEG